MDSTRKTTEKCIFTDYYDDGRLQVQPYMGGYVWVFTKPICANSFYSQFVNNLYVSAGSRD
jgi:hypothetical protein